MRVCPDVVVSIAPTNPNITIAFGPQVDQRIRVPALNPQGGIRVSWTEADNPVITVADADASPGVASILVQECRERAGDPGVQVDNFNV